MDFGSEAMVDASSVAGEKCDESEGEAGYKQEDGGGLAAPINADGAVEADGEEGHADTHEEEDGGVGEDLDWAVGGAKLADVVADVMVAGEEEADDN